MQVVNIPYGRKQENLFKKRVNLFYLTLPHILYVTYTCDLKFSLVYITWNWKTHMCICEDKTHMCQYICNEIINLNNVSTCFYHTQLIIISYFLVIAWKHERDTMIIQKTLITPLFVKMLAFRPAYFRNIINARFFRNASYNFSCELNN